MPPPHYDIACSQRSAQQAMDGITACFTLHRKNVITAAVRIESCEFSLYAFARQTCGMATGGSEGSVVLAHLPQHMCKYSVPRSLQDQLLTLQLSCHLSTLANHTASQQLDRAYHSHVRFTRPPTGIRLDMALNAPNGSSSTTTALAPNEYLVQHPNGEDWVVESTEWEAASSDPWKDPHPTDSQSVSIMLPLDVNGCVMMLQFCALLSNAGRLNLPTLCRLALCGDGASQELRENAQHVRRLTLVIRGSDVAADTLVLRQDFPSLECLKLHFEITCSPSVVTRLSIMKSVAGTISALSKLQSIELVCVDQSEEVLNLTAEHSPAVAALQLPLMEDMQITYGRAHRDHGWAQLEKEGAKVGQKVGSLWIDGVHQDDGGAICAVAQQMTKLDMLGLNAFCESPAISPSNLVTLACNPNLKRVSAKTEDVQQACKGLQGELLALETFGGLTCKELPPVRMCPSSDTTHSSVDVVGPPCSPPLTVVTARQNTYEDATASPSPGYCPTSTCNTASPLSSTHHNPLAAVDVRMDSGDELATADSLGAFNEGSGPSNGCHGVRPYVPSDDDSAEASPSSASQGGCKCRACDTDCLDVDNGSKRARLDFGEAPFAQAAGAHSGSGAETYTAKDVMGMLTSVVQHL